MSKSNFLSKLRSLFSKENSPEIEDSSEYVPSLPVSVSNDPRSQHYFFAHHFLKERAEMNASALVDKLREKNGTSYLKNFWMMQSVAAKSKGEKVISPHGLESFPVEVNDTYYGAIVQLPEPIAMVEAYFVAVLLNKSNQQTYRVITLELSSNSRGVASTVLGEWKGGGHFNYGDGPEPTRLLFVDSLKKLLG